MNFRILTPILLVTCVALASADEPTSPVERFQRALALEESEGDAKAALAIYRELAAETKTPAALRVRAELRVAACCERLGQRDEARQRYTELAGREKTWQAVAQAARAGAARLAPAPVAGEVSPLPQGWLSSWDPKTKRLNFAVKDADVRVLLCELARVGGHDLVLSPDVAGTVTTDLQRVSARRALEAIVETVGDYAMIEVEGILRVVPKSSLERQLVTEVYRLRPRFDELSAKLAAAKTPELVAHAAADLIAHQDHHRSLARVVSELLTTSAVPGTCAGYDPGTESIFVRCGRYGQGSVRKALARELAPAGRGPLPPTAGPKVSARFQDASIGAALTHLAQAANSPLVVGSQITGQVSLILNEVPFEAALRAVVETAGDYRLVQSPIGPRVTTRAASEARPTLRRWPLRGDPVQFWRRAHGATWDQGVGQWPGHPLTRVLSDMIVNASEPGAELQFDAGSHAILSNLSDDLAADLYQALERAGYLEPLPRPALAPGASFSQVNLRALLLKVAGELDVNVILAPQVSGQISAILPKKASPLELLEGIAAAAGDFVVQVLGPDLFRVTARATQERRLLTEVIPIPSSHLAPAGLYRAVHQLVVASAVPGASVLSSRDPRRAWSLVVTVPAREQALLGDIVRASVPTQGFKQAMTGRTLFVGGGGVQAHTIQPDGSLRVKVSPFSFGKVVNQAGWSHQLLPGGARQPYLLLSEKGEGKGKERRIERTELLPAK